MNKRLMRLAIVLLAGLALTLPAASPALAQPANDNFENATEISLPFSEAVDNSTAGLEDGEPVPSCMSGYSIDHTIWYKFAPDASGTFSTYVDAWWVFRAVYAGSSLDGLSEVSCYSWNGTAQLDLNAGTTYYIQVGSMYYDYSGSFTFSMEQILPPPNDNFADARVITELPFDDTVDTSLAGLETDEPTPLCAQGYPWGKSVWYAYTPTQSGTITARIGFPFSTGCLAAYAGDSLSGLMPWGSSCWNEQLLVQAITGTTLYFQAGGMYGEGGQLTFHLEVAPPPTAYFYFYPYDPSVFDTVQFYDNSYDPLWMGFASYAWDFGDGATDEGCCPTHRYAADGDYTVQLTVTTTDGRTGSTTQTVSVRTHDVAITKFSVPKAATVGQTRPIIVGLNSKRYVENVRVELYKSVPGGTQWVGTLIQTVPKRPANRTTDFRFSYTFTADDARIGKVTFKAVATLVDARDALPADNESISMPVRVTR